MSTTSPGPVRLTTQDVHVDRVLTQFAQSFRNSDYIARQVAPYIPVDKQSDLYRVWDKHQWFRRHVEKRAPGTRFPTAGFNQSLDPFFCDVYHLGYVIPWENKDAADEGIEEDRRAGEWLADQFDLEYEAQVAAKFFSTGEVTTDVDQSGASYEQWDELALSNPVDDVKTDRQTIHKLTGVTPDTLLIGPEVADVLIDHPLFIERMKYTEKGVLDLSDVASVMRVPKIVSGKAIENTGVPAPTDNWSSNYIWGKHALYFKTTQDGPQGAETPVTFRTFRWKLPTLMGGDGESATPVTRVVDDLSRKDEIQAVSAWDIRTVGADTGVFRENIIS